MPIAGMNGESRDLVAIVDKLDDAVAHRRSEPVVGYLLHKLSRYTRNHLAASETAAAAMAEEVGRFDHEYTIDPRPFVASELVDFLHDWLVGHISGMDMHYRPGKTR